MLEVLGHGPGGAWRLHSLHRTAPLQGALHCGAARKPRTVKFRPIRPLRLLATVLIAAVVVLLAVEFNWRARYALAKPQAPSPDGAYVAEPRGLPTSLGLGSGVFLRKRRDLLRSLHPRLVFAGSCEQLSLRWFGQRRLVITCEVRAGEPALLQDLVDDVRIELVVDRHFG